ncbi:cyclophilin type peptidyl-prolyl cis-trans isomerase [Nitzschia inconspicua]|uniref:Cyclophilin type peptidyl-prolyl cis-trans isomerase n=1 Tax=Nitzschia inconspicua TaxID=303405 RepID=A0A9K3LS75_9STRA|nr:cyclophilin type peptidyl-prolyl cis-trans isomerase [Nitzschia inconspicua]
MFHRRASTSSLGYQGSNPPPPSQFQRTNSVPTSGSSFFQESINNPSRNNNNDLSFLLTTEYYDNDKYGKAVVNKHVFCWRIVPCLVIMLLPWIPCQQTRWQIATRKANISSLIQEQKDLVDRLDETTANIKELRKEIEILSKDNELSFQEIHRNGREIGMDMESEQYAAIEKEEEALVARIEKLEKAIQKNSEKRLNERYGSSPYRVKVQVRDHTGHRSFFVIETALSMEMPHAMDHFLRMVEKKLWDGLTLVHEVGSKLIMATPTTMDDNSRSWAGKRFVDAKLTHMAFNEYSHTFPSPHHRKFSVAFSGRPGGPNFYINLDDESEFAHEHESTFGVVLEGRDVLQNLMLQKSDRYESKSMLTIESMEVLENSKSES